LPYCRSVKGDPVFFFDPWIQGNPVAKMKLEDVKLADVVCVTHGHDDHTGDSVALVKQTGAMLICSPEIGIYVLLIHYGTFPNQQMDLHRLMEEVRVRARKTVVGKWAPGESIEY
jgi:L-ascorbate metabolism protein UlaG (beta-lactamase superfamily)